MHKEMCENVVWYITTIQTNLNVPCWRNGNARSQNVPIGIVIDQQMALFSYTVSVYEVLKM